MRNIESPQFDGYNKTELPDTEIELELGGRLIEGVEPYPVLLKSLEQSEFEVVYRNDAVIADNGVKPEDFVYMIDNTEGIKVATIGRAPHWRNISTVGHTKFVDSNNTPHHYFEISTKGVGMVKSEVLENYDYDSLKRTNELGASINLGHAVLADFEWMGDVVALTKKLTDLGIRSELYWLVAKVDKVSYNGELYDVADAKKQDIIHRWKRTEPYVGVRLLRTNHRIEDYAKSSNIEDKKDMLLAVYDAFNQETELTGRDLPKLDIHNPEHQKIYFRTLLEQHIKNLSLLISNGLTYYHMHSSNLTLMGEIVDTAVVESVNIQKEVEGFEEYDTSNRTDMYHGVRMGYLKDMRDCILGIRMFMRSLKNDGYSVLSREEVYTTAKNIFGANLDISDKKVKKEDLVNVFDEIAKRMILDRETLPALKRNGIDSWNLASI